jgi:hypothetical protein
MRPSSKSCLRFISFLLSGSMLCPQHSFAEAENEILESWIGRYLVSDWINPPGAPTTDTTSEVLKTFDRIKSNLIGSTLDAAGINVYFALSESDYPKIMTHKFDPSYGAEKEWKSRNVGTWPVREAFGFSANEMPIYVLSFPKSLIQNISSEDELAFLLAKHLAKIISEADTSKNGSWQTDDGSSNIKAIEWLSGKYELTAAIKALELLHPSREGSKHRFRQTDVSLLEAAKNGSSPELNEGVEASIIQYAIENERRTNPKATPLTLKPVPQEILIWRELTHEVPSFVHPYKYPQISTRYMPEGPMEAKLRELIQAESVEDAYDSPTKYTISFASFVEGIDDPKERISAFLKIAEKFEGPLTKREIFFMRYDGLLFSKDIKLLLSGLSNNDFSTDEKIRLIRFLTLIRSDFSGFNDEYVSDRSTKQSLRSFWQTQSKADILNLLSIGSSWRDNYRGNVLRSLPREGLSLDKEQASKWGLKLRRTFETSGAAFSPELIKGIARQQINMLSLMAASGEIPHALKEVSFDEYRILQKLLIENVFLTNISRYPPDPHSRSLGNHPDAARVLSELFIGTSSKAKNFQEWLLTYEDLKSLLSDTYFFSPAQLTKIREIASEHLKSVSPQNKYRWMKRTSLQSVLGTERQTQYLLEYLAYTTKSDRSLKKLAAEVSRINTELHLHDKFPEVYRNLRNALAEKRNLQPNEINVPFPQDPHSNSAHARGVELQTRGLSSIVSIIRMRPVSEQIEVIEYLMGRREKLPRIFADTDRRVKKAGYNTSLLNILAQLRSNLTTENLLARSFVVNSIIGGPNGSITNGENLNSLLDFILSSVSEKNRDLARILATSLLKAEGLNKSLFLSYVLSQNPEGNGGNSAKLDEASVLKALLDSYGVPGVKLAQYLAFTNDFKDFRVALESYQDAAMPLSYFDMLTLVKKRLGDSWNNERHHITRMIGSGSVNIAVEYTDRVTGKSDVLNVSRKDIEVKTAEDFRRFKSFMEELGRDPDHGQKFEFVTGLMDIVKDSVELEFDKPHAFEMQRSVQKLYDRQIDGWHVKTVDAYEVVGMSIFMQKAPGVGARKVLESDPGAYKAALRALWKVEDEALRGVNESGNIRPVSLHANPDLHDGQVLIDVKNKVVTILDFGQAEKISNEERNLAIDTLRIISGTENSRSALNILHQYFRKEKGTATRLTQIDFNEVFSKADRMDRFVRLVSLLNRHGFKLPLSTVHWVLAANRLIKLGEKIDVPAEATFRNLVISRKLGVPLSIYNAGAKLAELTQQARSTSKPMKTINRCSAIFSR